MIKITCTTEALKKRAAEIIDSPKWRTETANHEVEIKIGDYNAICGMEDDGYTAATIFNQIFSNEEIYQS